MTSSTKIDAWQCEGPAPRPLHSWLYHGKRNQTYHCQTCGLRMTKDDLKGATDNG